MPRRRGVAGLLALLFAGGCRSVAVEVPLSPRWEELVTPPPRFAALYRLSCCGQRQLPAVVRGDGDALAVAVALPPAGVAWEAWFQGSQGVSRRRGEACVTELPLGEVALPGGGRLPLDASLWGTLLAGRLPPSVKPLAGQPGWVASEVGEGRLLARCGGEPPRCNAALLEQGGRRVLDLRLDRHHGRVPGRVHAIAGKERVLLELAEWGPGTALTAPEWVSWPRCGP